MPATTEVRHRCTFCSRFLFCVASSSENLAYDSRNVLVASFFNYYFLLLVCVWIYFFRETESIRDAQALFCHEEEDN